MKLKVAVLAILLVLSSFVVLAEEPEPPKPVLKVGDVKHFIKTFPILKKEFEKFNIKYETQSGNLTYPDVVKASGEFLEILKKHGWDEHFFHKMSTIVMGYSSIVYKKEIKKADPQIEKSIKEIKSNPHLSEDMKKQLIDQMKTVKGALKTQKDAFSKRINKADLDLIMPHVEGLKEVLEESKESKDK